MSIVQVLVTTMHQNDNSKYYDMNIKTDAVIANQADKTENSLVFIEGNSVRLVTTNTRGVSKNRNIALSHMSAEAQYIVFADDDMCFRAQYSKTISNAFQEHPDADAIKFTLNCTSERKLSMKPTTAFHRAGRREVTASGVVGLAIRKAVMESTGLRFNENYGPGTANYCGEDTIFLQELFKKKIRFYLSTEMIADIHQGESSWFKGYDEMYFTTAGKIIAEIYPFLACLLAVRSAYRFSKRKKSPMSFRQILKCYNRGIRDVRRKK